MGWTAYRLVYQAKSPVHIGWHTLGYIKLTRYYITGKAIWGALTANLTRACFTYDDYIDVGNLLCSSILTGYFYPSLDPDSLPMLPEYTENGLMYGDYKREDFERLYIKSYGQTAVLPESNTAEDGSLHESEYIQPVIEKDGRQRQVYFIGYIFINDDAEYNGVEINLQNIREALTEIFVGGDRKYGWGRLRLFNKPDEEGNQSRMFGLEIKLDGEYPLVAIPQKGRIPAHLLIDHRLRLKGDIEPLVGREWEKKTRKAGAGQRISEARICWTPGSVLLEEKLTLKVCKFGILDLSCEDKNG